jgi:2-polyprenyl-3-methyl-5-hydroxy-6-metoxy-1,4-benzoquinol methylase
MVDMKNIQVLLRMLSTGWLLKRAKVFSQYLYYLVLEWVSPTLSLQHPKLRSERGSAKTPARDASDSIEFHLEADANARKEFVQPDKARTKFVTHVPDKYRATRCSVCDGPLQPVVQVVDADDQSDMIEMSWCPSCDHSQYSIMPSKSWITNWYATNWDSGGTIEEKLENRRPTYRAYRRLLPHLGDRKLKVLDIGAGYGEKVLPFGEAGHDVHCTEATPRRAAYLREHVTQNVYFGTLDDPAVRTALLENGPFDVFFTYHVIEHIYDARAELRILEEIAAPGAIFYLAIPELYKEAVFNNIYSLEHTASFSRLSAKTLMQQSGFIPVVAKDDLFQYYSNYCQYLIGRKAAPSERISLERNPDPEKFGRYLSRVLRFDRVAGLDGSYLSYSYDLHEKLTYRVSDETKLKCRDPMRHLPLRIYHQNLPLFWMYS